MINFNQIKAFVFDNDGVIVNSEPLSCLALHTLFEQEFGVDIGQDYSQVIGTSDSHTFNYFADQTNITLPTDLTPLIAKKTEIYFHLASHELQPFDGFHELLNSLSKNYDLAIASSGGHDKIKFSINMVDASKYFPIICSATEVKHGKPAPDLFHFVAECLAIPEQSCVVVEDSIKGIQGAKAAGMMTIGFTSSFSRQALLDAGADLVIDSFSELLDMIKYKT